MLSLNLKQRLNPQTGLRLSRRIGSLAGKLQNSSVIRQQACYAIGIIGMKAVAFLLLPFVTHQLGVAEFARLETLLALVNGATVIVGCGLVNNLYREAGLAESESERQRASATTSGTALTLALISFLLLAANGLWLLPVINQYWQVSQLEFLLLSLLISSEGVLAVPLAWLRMREQAVRFLQLTLGRTLIYAALAVILLKLGYGLTGVLIASVIAILLQIAGLLYLQIRDAGIRIQPQSLLRQIRFGLPFVVSGLAMYATQGLDIILLSQSAEATTLAAYVLAVKFFLLAALLSQPFQLWWYPRRITLLKQDDGLNKAASGAMAGAIIASILGLGVVVAAPLVTPLLFAPELQVLHLYLPWLILAGIFKQWGALFNLGCFSTERSEIQMLIELATGALCLLTLPFAIDYGAGSGIGAAMGAVAVLLVSQILRLIAYLIISQRLLKLPYQKQHLIYALIPCGLISLQVLIARSDAFQSSLILQLAWLLLCMLVSLVICHRVLLKTDGGLLRRS